jgi:Fuc2NAc and GlcNAc transferase
VCLPGTGAWAAPAALAAAAAGFLVWNAPPARIFLGDVGSGFLGFAFGVLALAGAQREPALLWAWLVLLGVFVADATVTLVRRALRGQRVYEAHRTHAYQHAARGPNGHARVAFTAAAINLCWLTPIAASVATRRLDGLAGLAIAYAPLAWLAARGGAGLEAPIETGRPGGAR